MPIFFFPSYKIRYPANRPSGLYEAKTNTGEIWGLILHARRGGQAMARVRQTGTVRHGADDVPVEIHRQVIEIIHPIESRVQYIP